MKEIKGIRRGGLRVCVHVSIEKIGRVRLRAVDLGSIAVGATGSGSTSVNVPVEIERV